MLAAGCSAAEAGDCVVSAFFPQLTARPPKPATNTNELSQRSLFMLPYRVRITAGKLGRTTFRWAREFSFE